MIVPPSLQSGDVVAIVSPATIVKEEYIDGASEFLRSEGFTPRVMPHAKGASSGSYAASDEDRLADLREAFQDSDVKAILCARGGYGCNHLLEGVGEELVREHPKWLIGFSDVSALHALSGRAGVVSLHAPMAKHLATLPCDQYCTRALMRILTEGLPIEYIAPPHPFNREGESEGMLIGGNLAVINGLADTPYDPFRIAREAGETHPILFIEDISEAIYAVERMLIRLHLGGHLKSLGGMVVGAFTEYRADRNHADMESMISALLDRYGYEFPTAFGFPAGHTDDNLPLPMGATARLSVTAEGTTLTF
ncbi:MAG: LD-carboxypeptidase [Muribaculaceae bacterium]|nr:LD-carboxypeptidase [Muribaculaceae bacterium]